MDATFVPPPVDEMNTQLGLLEKYLHTQSPLPPLIRLAMVHYQFEAIHPFLDGNGRIGRLLITLLLCTEKLLPQPLLYLSAYFEKYRDEYYRNLLGVSEAGRWEQWITFFLHAVAVQARDAVRRSDELLALWREYRARLQEARSSALALRLVDDLFQYPALTNPAISKRLAITPRSAQLNIDKLRRAGIVQEATGHRRNRVYIAPEIIRIVEEHENEAQAVGADAGR